MIILKYSLLSPGAYTILCSCGKVILRNKLFIHKHNLLHADTNKTCICKLSVTKHITKKDKQYKAKTKQHNMSHTKIYRIWSGMLARCNNPNNPGYKHYGARGIKVEWDNFISFYKDMGIPPIGLSIDRIHNDKNYNKNNCKWSTQTEQMNNTRTAIQLCFKNKCWGFRKWAEITKLPLSALRSRYKCGWATDKILTTPLSKCANRHTKTEV